MCGQLVEGSVRYVTLLGGGHWRAILDSTFLAFIFSSNWTALANLLTPPWSLLWLVCTVLINKVGVIVPEVQLKC